MPSGTRLFECWGFFYQENKWCRKNCLGLIWVAVNTQLGSERAAFSARAGDTLVLHGLFINGDFPPFQGLWLGGRSQWCCFKRHLANDDIHVQYDKKIKPFAPLIFAATPKTAFFIHIQYTAWLYHLETCRIHVFKCVNKRNHSTPVFEDWMDPTLSGSSVNVNVHCVLFHSHTQPFLRGADGYCS